MRPQSVDGVVGDDRGHVVGRLVAFRPEPLRRPVQRAEERAGGEDGIGRLERAGTDSIGDQRADAALVPIALGDDRLSQPAGKGVDFEVRGGAFHLVDEREHVRFGEGAQTIRQRSGAAPRVGERAQELLQRSVLAEEQELVLPAEVVIQIARREVGGDRDVAHAGGGEPPLTEDAPRRAQDLHAPAVGAA